MPSRTDDYLAELDIVTNNTDPRCKVPPYRCAGSSVLDIGCGVGQTLMSEEFSEAVELNGIDIDSEAVGSKLVVAREPRMRLVHGAASALPYPDNHFELVYARVAFPYTNIPVALAEAFRVLRRRGQIWMTRHTWRLGMSDLRSAIAAWSPGAIADRLYVLANSLLFELSGIVSQRPWDSSYESVQTASSMRRSMVEAGFVEIRSDVTLPFFIVEARKAGAG